MSWRQRARSWAGGWSVALALATSALPALAREPQPVSPQAAATVASLPTVPLDVLPQQARKVYRLILAGGPFPYEKDGVVFGNRERILPRADRGYYREYTVAAPRAKNRGPKRIVCGGTRPANPDHCYYTDDHYASFRRIVAGG